MRPRRKRYRIAVLREENSRGGSLTMHRLAAGDHLPISAPRNNFRLAPARRHLLFAAGIGVTPLLAMAQQLDVFTTCCSRALGPASSSKTGRRLGVTANQERNHR